MELFSLEKINLEDYNKTSDCEVYCIHVRIKDVKAKVEEITQTILDTSWINQLRPTIQSTYKARAFKTIKKIVTEILAKVEDEVTDDFGEYLVSFSAKDSLVNYNGHTDIPLAELLGKKKSGNSGFDFHTITQNDIIAFGEAKYTSNGNPHSDAVKQICGFIDDEKDLADILHLEHFAGEERMEKLIEGKKAFIAAFSINGKRYKSIFNYIIKSKLIDPLLDYPELYLIGVEVCQ